MNNNDLFKKYINNELSKSEETEFYSRIKNAEMDLEILKDMDENSPFLVFEECETDRHTQTELFKKIEQQITKKNYFKICLKYAAIVIPLLLLSVTGLYFLKNDWRNNEFEMIHASKGEQLFLELEDGTKVWLNSDSRIWIPGKFGKKNRIVQMEGEAYFDVAKDKDRLFQVKVNEMVIQVHGTKFNVLAYEESKTLEVSLDAGSIETILERTGDSVTLTPGELIKVSKFTGEYQKQFFDPDKEHSWRDKYLVFSENTLEDVMIQLSKRYDFKYRIVDEAALTYTYTMKYKDEKLQTIFDDMQMISPIKIEHNNNIIEIRLK